PKTRQVTRWLLTRPDRLSPDDQARLAAVKASCPHLDALAGHIRSFAEMMTRRQGLLALEDWLTRVEADDQPELRSFANGIRRDQQAVTAGRVRHVLGPGTLPAPRSPLVSRRHLRRAGERAGCVRGHQARRPRPWRRPRGAVRAGGKRAVRGRLPGDRP